MSEIIQGKGIAKIDKRTFLVKDYKLKKFFNLIDQAGLIISGIEEIEIGSLFRFKLTGAVTEREWPYPILHSGANVYSTELGLNGLIAALAKKGLFSPRVLYSAGTAHLIFNKMHL